MESLLLHGRRIFELQKWRNLRVTLENVSGFANRFSSASAGVLSLQDGRKRRNFTVSFLVDSMGLTTKLAESISKEISFEDKKNPDSVLGLLKIHGFTKTQISKMISTYPKLLITDAEKSLSPKLQILQSKGASNSEFTDIVSKVPRILEKKGPISLRLYYDFVKEIIHIDEDGEKSFNHEKLCLWPEGKGGNKIRNLSILKELGVPHRFLLPLLISRCQPICGKEKFQECMNKVIEMGFDPTSSKFVEALHVFYKMREKTIEEKLDIYKRLGFTESEIWSIFKRCPFFLKFSEKKITETFEAFKKCGLLEDEVLLLLKKSPQCIRISAQKIENSIETFLEFGFTRDEFRVIVMGFPTCLGLSVETLKKKIEFLVKKMNWPLKDMLVIPPVLGYSFEKRIVPRCNVIKALMAKGLLGNGNEIPPMSAVLASTDQTFLNRFVKKHEKLVPELMAIFTKSSVGYLH